MSTSEERREIAERLRKASAHRQGIRCDAVDKALGLWYDDSYFVGCVFARESVRRLADLIDPTCHNQHPRASDGCFCCSECLFLYEPTDWSACRNGFLYCPRCGARVVRGGED